MKAPDLTDLAVAWVRSTFPDAYVTTEMSVAQWGGAMLDVAAITRREIVAVEVKGDGDSPTRLALQGAVYGRVCRRIWLLPSPDLAGRCTKHRPSGWGMLDVVDGRVTPSKVSAQEQHHLSAWTMTETLWRDELYSLAKTEGVAFGGGSRATANTLRRAIVDQVPTPVIHDLMILALRRRDWGFHKTVYHPSEVALRSCVECQGSGKWRGDGGPRGDLPCGYCRGTGETPEAKE